MYKKVFILMFIIVLFSNLNGSIVELKELVKPVDMRISKDYIYISDSASIKLYERKTIKYVKTIGRKGNGPKEFQYSPRLQLLSNGIVAYLVNKIYLIDKFGIVNKENKLNIMYVDLKKIKNRFIGVKFSKKPNDFYLEYFLLNQNFKPQKTIYQHKWSNHLNGTRELFYNSFFGVYNKKLFIIPNMKEFKIDILNSKGKLEKTIKKKKTLIPFAECDKQEFWKMWKKQKIDLVFQKKIVLFPKYLPAIFKVLFSNDKLYIITYLEKNEKRECYLYNLKGKQIKRIFIPLKINSIAHRPLFSIKDNKIYQLIDNEENETWEMQIKNIYN